MQLNFSCTECKSWVYRCLTRCPVSFKGAKSIEIRAVFNRSLSGIKEPLNSCSSSLVLLYCSTHYVHFLFYTVLTRLCIGAEVCYVARRKMGSKRQKWDSDSIMRSDYSRGYVCYRKLARAHLMIFYFTIPAGISGSKLLTCSLVYGRFNMTPSLYGFIISLSYKVILKYPDYITTQCSQIYS